MQGRKSKGQRPHGHWVKWQVLGEDAAPARRHSLPVVACGEGGDFLPMPANAAARCQWVLYRLTSAGLPRIIRLFARLLLRRAMAKKGPDEDGAEGTTAPPPESGNDRQTCIYSLGARYWHYAELPPTVRLSARCAARRHTILSCLAKPGLASEWMRAWRY
jgi:hypothetical protein